MAQPIRMYLEVDPLERVAPDVDARLRYWLYPRGTRWEIRTDPMSGERALYYAGRGGERVIPFRYPGAICAGIDKAEREALACVN